MYVVEQKGLRTGMTKLLLYCKKPASQYLEHADISFRDA